MKQTLFENESPEKRLEMLSDNAYEIKETTIKRFHTPEEKELLRNTATDQMINCQEIEEKIKDLTEPLKGELKMVKAELKTNLTAFKRGYESQETRLFAFDDQEDGMMCFYDGDGKLVESRKLYPAERQTKILNINDQKQQES